MCETPAPSLAVFKLSAPDGQLGVEYIALTDIIVAIKRIELSVKGGKKSEEKLRKSATKLLRDHKKKPDCKLGQLKTKKDGKLWIPVATSVAEYEYLFSLMKLNSETMHQHHGLL
jgi:hypothetical protein